MTDAALIDEALAALLARHRAAEVDESYAAYDFDPMTTTPGATWRRGDGGRRLMSGLPARGEIWWCELPEIGRRPVVVLSRDAAIPRLRRTLVAPCTTTIRGLASEVVLDPAADPIPRRSAVDLDSLENLSVSVLVGRLARLADARMRDICALSRSQWTVA